MHAARALARSAPGGSARVTPLLAAQIGLTLVVFVALLSSAAGMVYVERKVAPASSTLGSSEKTW